MNDLMRAALGTQESPNGNTGSPLQGRDCPSPEIWHEFASDLLGEDRTVSSGSAWTAARLESHAESCGSCAAELEMARAFVREAQAAVAATIEEAVRPAPAAHRGSATVLSLDTERAARAAAQEDRAVAPRRAASSAWLAAAAVVLALVAGYATWVSRPPSIQAPGTEAVMRGDSVALLEPLDQVDSVPSTFDWEPRDGATSYLVEVTRLDGRVVVRREVAAPPMALTGEEQANLLPRVRYEWKVQALRGPSGSAEERQVLQSVSSSFTIRDAEGRERGTEQSRAAGDSN